MDYPSTPAFSFPVIRSLEFDTQIFAGQNGVEQRIMRHAGRESWELSYSRLTLAERNLLIDGFETAKGAAANDVAFTLMGTTYAGCYFDGDTLEFTDRDAGYFEATVRLAQVVRTPDAGTLPADFPTLATECRVQRPYTHKREYDTTVVRTEGGRYARANREAARRTWSAGGTVLTMAEAQAIWDMVRLARGRYHTFAFTDPDSGTRYENCRFNQDKVTWRMAEAGRSEVAVEITQTV